ncbi:MAG: alkaline phosphatase family protein [Clostridiales bacterium]|nr:alkaline phosphatase family protein [Clostridiales bacterium]
MKQLPSLPDYDHCLVNLASSVLKHFGAEYSAPTLSLADTYLAKDHKNVVVLLLDAMGVSILQKHLSENGFFRSHLAGSYSSVFPPTTVAATTSVLSGKYPDEHAWLGWDCYFPELGKNVTVYTNSDQLIEAGSPFSIEKEARPGDYDCPAVEERRPAADFHVGFTYTPYENIVSKIINAGGNAYFSSPYAEPNPQDLDAILKRVTDLCREPEKKFIYAYWNEPDSTMHRTGTVSKETHEIVTALEKRVEEFAEGLSDTLLFITADHGHMDSKNLCILDYPEIVKCLVRMPGIEPRALNLFIKDEYKDEFPALFEKTFGDKFRLVPKDEVIERKLFGLGTEHPKFRDKLGDFLAIAVSDTSLFNTHVEAKLMPGGHAGLTKEELEIPLIAIERK